MDQEGNIVVSDCCNHGISLLSPVGAVLCQILTQDDGIKHPRGLCITKQGQLVVGQMDGVVKVFQYGY